MEKIIRNLLNKNNLEIPPSVLNEELYNWLEAAGEKQNVRFVSDTPMPQKDFQRLKSQLGEVPSELAYYYARSTPWAGGIGIDDYFEAANRIEAECISIFKRNRISEEEASLQIREGSTLWPVYISVKGSAALSFSDSTGRLCVVEGAIHGGHGFGTPFSIGLRNFLVMSVIADLFWFETEDEISYKESLLHPMILSIGEWPTDESPVHYMIDCFNLTN